MDDPEHAVFDARERAVLRFTTAMCQNDNAQAESRVDELKAHFDEAQIVEIAFAITTLHGMNMFNNMFHIEPEETPMVSYTGVAHDSAGAAADCKRIAS